MGKNKRKIKGKVTQVLGDMLDVNKGLDSPRRGLHDGIIILENYCPRRFLRTAKVSTFVWVEEIDGLIKT